MSLLVVLLLVFNSCFMSIFLTFSIVAFIGVAEYPLFIMSMWSLSACVRYAVVELQMRRRRRHWLYAILSF